MCPDISNGSKGLPLAMLQDKPGAWHPIRLFAIDQVADDIKDGPCALTFVRHGPVSRQIPQERIERGRSAREKGNRVGEGRVGSC